MLTVKDLIEQLKTYSPDLRVVVPGYEGGYNDLSSVEELTLALYVHQEDYYGNHEVKRNIKNTNNFLLENAICLSGYRDETHDTSES